MIKLTEQMLIAKLILRQQFSCHLRYQTSDVNTINLKAVKEKK